MIISDLYSDKNTLKANHSYEIEIPKIEERFLVQTLLTLNDDSYTLGDVLEWIKIHPLVFRKGYLTDLPFANQLKYALADLIRDRELNKEAQKRKLNIDPEVLREYEKWYDNYQAMKNRNVVFGDKDLSSLGVPDELNEYFYNLVNKYSDQIWINMDALNSINLSSIDMMVYNNIGGYKINTPIFPIITSHHQIDYGQLME